MIGIIGAMDSEVKDLLGIIKDYKTEEHAGLKFYSGKLEGTDCVIVRCGIGKVNAAVAAEILAGIYKVDKIINTGIAGSLNAAIDIGDIVLSTDALQHDMDVTALGYKKGVIPDQECSVFPADEELRKLAKEACEAVNKDVKVFEGRVVSGDQFISDKKVKDEIVQLHNGMCTEMEGASIAQVSYMNKIPYLVIRAISDKADDSAEMDYPSFQAKAIEHSVKLVCELFRRLS